MARPADDRSRIAHLEGEGALFLQAVAEHERDRRRAHGMDIQQEVGLLERGAEFAGARKLDTLPRPLQGFERPHPVEVLIDEPRRAGIPWAETLIGRNIGEGKRQHAPPRPDALAEQEIERDGSANLVAVGDGIDEHMRARRAAVETVDIIDAGIAGFVWRYIGGFEFHGEARHRAFLVVCGCGHLSTNRGGRS